MKHSMHKPWTRFCSALAAVLIAALAVPSFALAASATPAASISPTPAPTPWEGLFEGTSALLKSDSEGDLVVALQTRLKDLGYYNFKVTGFYGATTRSAVEEFQSANNLAPDGDAGEQTLSLLFTNVAVRGYGPRGKPTPTPKWSSRVQTRYGKLLEWSRAKSAVPKSGGGRFKVQDFYTGTSYYLIRVGGTYHMDVEPAKKADTAAVKKTYNGRWSHERRPVLVRFGSEWYAASIYGMPHGEHRVAGNGINGMLCLHFVGSMTHVRGLVDPGHQRCIKIAAGKLK